MKDKIKIHIYGLPHTLTVRDNSQMMTCAYTTKVWLLADHLTKMGHEVIHYGVEIPDHVEGIPVNCTEHVPCIPYDVWYNIHGKRDKNTSFHEHETDMETYKIAAKTFPEEINKRIKDPSKEVVLASFGYWSPTLGDIDKAALIEFGIGYSATFSTYKVYESYAWQHTMYGIADTHLKAPGWFDAVIPGYVDPNEFEFKKEKEDYFLFVGRIIDTKGIYVAVQMAERYGFKLKVAGNGNTDWVKDYPNVEYVGVVGVEAKKKLYANAKATFTNTHYVEPFGNVHIESMISGTPVIATDWGVYTETVPQGLTGFRGRTWEDFEYAFNNIDKINPQDCRDWAMANFTLDAVYPKFNAYFEKAARHFSGDKGWYFNDQENREDYFVNYWKNYQDYLKK